MASPQHDLSIRGESVQRIYNYYINSRLIVNRRYQRKLVWSIEEKRNFIDSIVKGFPVPLILLAETDKPSKQFEMIDGMQRLNAIMSFIEGEFDYQDGYFDLNTMVESKSLFDSRSLDQNTPILARNLCETVSAGSARCWRVRELCTACPKRSEPNPRRCVLRRATPFERDEKNKHHEPRATIRDRCG